MGQGIKCGRPTTRKHKARVVPKREVVNVERGWSAGGISESGDASEGGRVMGP